MRMWPSVSCLIHDVGVMAYKVELDSIACIGCVGCTSCEIFEMRQDMKAHAVQNIVSEIGCISEVAEDCPVGAISFSWIVPNTPVV
jgi:ferredoxin